MLFRRLLHALAALALISFVGLLIGHAAVYRPDTDFEGLPFRMGALYAISFASGTSLLSALICMCWRFCTNHRQRIAVTLGFTVAIGWVLSDVGGHIAQGDGISTYLDPEIGTLVFTSALAVVCSTLLCTLALYLHSGWRARILGKVRIYRPSVRFALVALALAVAALCWKLPDAMHLHGTRAVLMFAWAALSVGIAVLASVPRQLALDLAVVACIGWAGHSWNAEPETAQLLSSVNASRFRPLADVADLWPLHTDASKPRYELLAYDCEKVTPDACGAPGAETDHVVLISVDALRKDALRWRDTRGAPLAPNLEAFAKQAVVYERASTTYPATLLALGGVVSGLSPIELTLAEKPPNFVRDANDAGIATHAFFPSSGWFSKKSFTRLVLDDFDHVTRSDASVDAVEATVATLREATTDERLFIWLHLFDPHAPYDHDPSSGFDSNTLGKYKSEVRKTDAALATLFAELNKDRWRNTTVIFFADHGESLDDYIGHHVYLNRAIADIPLMVRSPGLASTRTQKAATLSDITLTVRHALGMQPFCGSDKAFDLRLPEEIPDDRTVLADAFSMRGSTLFRFLNTPVRSQKAIESRLKKLDSPADYEPKTAAITSTHRGVFHHRSGRFELFDRRAKKEAPLKPGRAIAVRKQLQKRLQQWMRTAPLRAACLYR